MKTKLAFIFIFCLFIILFIPFWIIQFLALMLFFLILISYFISKITYKNITGFYNADIIRAYKKKPVHIEITIKNNSFLLIPFVSIKDSSDQLTVHENKNITMGFLPGETKKYTYIAEANQRGEYKIGPIKIAGSDPLGFFKWEKILDKHCNIIIYPSTFNINRPMLKGIPGGTIKVNNKIYEDITQFRSIREYITGDDPRRINWKISAKLNAPHVMEYSPALSSPAIILLNLDVNQFPLRYRFDLIEKSVETAASLINYYLTKKQLVGLISNGHVDNNRVLTNMGKYYSHIILMLEELAKIKEIDSEKETDNIDIADLLNFANFKIPNRTKIIFISPTINEYQSLIFNTFKLKGYFLEFYCLKEEQDYHKYEKIIFDNIFNMNFHNLEYIL